MIRDFLDHLMWQLRIAHFEVTSKPGTLNADLVKQLKPFLVRHPCALVAQNEVDPTGVTPAEAEEACTKLRAGLAELFEERIAYLEALGPVFEEALMCASRPWTKTSDGGDWAMVHKWPARELLGEEPSDSED